MKRSFVSLSLALLAGCGAAPEPILVPPPPATSAPLPVPNAAPGDAIGERPTVAAPAAFVPAVPVVLEGPGGSKIWLVERHSLPLVSIAIASSVGGAADPAGQAGLSVITAGMVDEGAGTRDALAFSAALEELGASVDTSADRDKSLVRLDVLAAKLPDALSLVADAILRPRHDDKDFTRVSSLWKNDLKARGDDPNEVARVVVPAALYGLDHPYGRPVDGTLETANRVKLADVKRWHHAVWRPDRTTFVVVGDITPDAARELLGKAFAGFTNPKEPPPAVVMPKTAAKVPRAVIVDRADAPQVIMSVVRDGVLASNEALPRLTVLNVALGGSFTSRLNQNLREDHGWTYGARSMFVAQRGAGLFLARAAIRTDVIEPALKETLKEITALSKDGLSDEETGKAKSLQRAGAVETYGSLGGIARSLATNAALGLPPDQDARELTVQAAVTKADLAPLAQKYLALDAACIVLVGPKKVAEAALKAAGVEGAELRDPDGKLLGKPAAKPAAAPKKRLPSPVEKCALRSSIEAHGPGQRKRDPLAPPVRRSEARGAGQRAADFVARGRNARRLATRPAGPPVGALRRVRRRERRRRSPVRQGRPRALLRDGPPQRRDEPADALSNLLSARQPDVHLPQGRPRLGGSLRLGAPGAGAGRRARDPREDPRLRAASPRPLPERARLGRALGRDVGRDVDSRGRREVSNPRRSRLRNGVCVGKRKIATTLDLEGVTPRSFAAWTLTHRSTVSRWSATPS